MFYSTGANQPNFDRVFAVYIRFNLNVSTPLKRAWLNLFQKKSIYIFFRLKTDNQNRRSGVELTLQSWAIMFGDKTTAKEKTYMYMDFSHKFRTIVSQFSSAILDSLNENHFFLDKFYSSYLIYWPVVCRSIKF